MSMKGHLTFAATPPPSPTRTGDRRRHFSHVATASANDPRPSPSYSSPHPTPPPSYHHPAKQLALLRNFTPAPFTPFLSPNPHFQTIAPHFFPRPSHPAYTRTTLPSDDGLATIHIDIVNGTSLAPQPGMDPHVTKGDTSPVVVIVPGMESDSRAVVTRRIINAMPPHFKVVAMNHRSCAPMGTVRDLPTTLRLYHAGFTEDIETVLRVLRTSAVEKGFPPPTVFLCAFSLGANMVLNMLCKLRGDAESRFGIRAVAVAAVPFRPGMCIQKFDTGLSGMLYSAHLTRTLVAKLKAAFRNGVSSAGCNVDGVLSASRVGDIDASFIAPVFGFRDRWEYYEQVDVTDRLGDVCVPTVVWNARDDPLFDHASGVHFPAREVLDGGVVKMHVLEHGGHCGFLDFETVCQGETGYFQREFARWFEYVWAKMQGTDAEL